MIREEGGGSFPRTGKGTSVSEGVMCKLGGKGFQAKSGSCLYG